jgi:hypothetical protein
MFRLHITLDSPKGLCHTRLDAEKKLALACALVATAQDDGDWQARKQISVLPLKPIATGLTGNRENQ